MSEVAARPDIAQIASRTVGRPWSSFSFDCWEFVRVVYQEGYGIRLPKFPGVDGAVPGQGAAALAEARASGDWRPVCAPETGDAVTMGRISRPHHCGVYIATDRGPKVAHCDAPQGVALHSLRQLGVLGWSGLAFYRHRDRP